MIRFVLLTTVLTGAACSSTLQGGLDEQEANEMTLVLAEAGIEAEKVGTGTPGEAAWSVEVEGEDLSAAWRTLRAAGLPRPHHTGFRSVYRERGLVPGRLEERALYLSALQEEIAQTLESVEGIVSARVHVTLQADRRPGLKERDGATASVLICHHATTETPPITAAAVQKLVSHAVTGLVPAKVAVVFAPRRRIAAAANPRTGHRTSAGPGRVVRTAAVGLGSAGLMLGIVLFLRRRRHARNGSVRPGSRPCSR